MFRELADDLRSDISGIVGSNAGEQEQEDPEKTPVTGQPREERPVVLTGEHTEETLVTDSKRIAVPQVALENSLRPSSERRGHSPSAIHTGVPAAQSAGLEGVGGKDEPSLASIQPDIPGAAILPRLTVLGFLSLSGSVLLPDHQLVGAVLLPIIGLVIYLAVFALRYYVNLATERE
ncbi:hypothetical protein HZA87_02845 [Candidatus Uhrbacteria bacterium]|nr:hypothetical protein [Candidatus Uhrbacteria bacterium]